MPYVGNKSTTFNTFSATDVSVTDDLTVTDDASVGGTVTVNSIIQTTTSDGDMVLKGNDGGSTITALTLDMSDAGTATFNHDVKLPDSGELILGAGSDIRLYHDGSNSYLKSSTNNLFISSAASLILDADGSGDFIFRDSDIGDEANKVIRFSTPSHDTNEENVQILQVESEASSNQITFGGGTSGLNASTKMIFRTAAVDTTTGSNRLDIDSSGNVVFNEDSADADFRIESNGNTNAFHIDADKGVVSIGNDADYAWRNNNGDQQMDISTFGCLYAQGGGSLILASNWFRAADNTITAKTTGVGTGYFGEGVSGGNHVFFTGASASAGAAMTLTERFKIALNGDLTGTDTSIASNSDVRLKENIEDYSYDINKVKAMQVKQFDWKEKNLHATPTGQIGFIAQELEKIEPKFVRENEQKENSAELKYLDEDGMAKTSVLGEKDAMYISIIQQLIARIEKLEDK